jgi:subtilisin family serine protease
MADEKDPEDDPNDIRDRLTRVTAPPELDQPENRKKWKLEDPNRENRGPYLVELNIQHVGGLPAAEQAFLKLYRDLFAQRAAPAPDAESSLYEEAGLEPTSVGKGYYRCYFQVREWRQLIAEDERRAGLESRGQDAMRYRCIYKLWPDFPVRGQISRSVATIKADAAYRSFDASGEEITWAVIDSGVQADHPHFGQSDEVHALRHSSVRELHRCFAPTSRLVGAVRIPGRLADPDKNPAMPTTTRDALVKEHVKRSLTDDFGHGTHVAGVITGQAPKVPVVVLRREAMIDVQQIENDDLAQRKETRADEISDRERSRFHGIAPECRIISLRVLDENGEGRSSDVIRALEYIREKLNDNPKLLRVHGVNLSVGYEFDAEMFACGQSPLCNEVNRLVQSGVVVVTAAGNTGYGTVNAQTRPSKVGLSNTINDPGNAELAITVGATHRDAPHKYGVSYFSSKGPTGDGRLKPDIVAPGERIISCAAGKKLKSAMEELHASGDGPSPEPRVPSPGTGTPPASPLAVLPYLPPDGTKPAGRAYYVEDTGTSMAAPHVSGAIAAFLSVRREFIGRPLEVKRIFLDSAIPLGRERYFEGHGLLDLMKAIQSV